MTHGEVIEPVSVHEEWIVHTPLIDEATDLDGAPQ